MLADRRGRGVGHRRQRPLVADVAPPAAVGSLGPVALPLVPALTALPAPYDLPAQPPTSRARELSRSSTGHSVRMAAFRAAPMSTAMARKYSQMRTTMGAASGP